MATSLHHSFIDKEVLCSSLQTFIRVPGYSKYPVPKPTTNACRVLLLTEAVSHSYIACNSYDAYALHGTCYQEDAILLVYIICTYKP